MRAAPLLLPLALALVLALASTLPTSAGEVQVAVATNFADAAAELAERFEARGEHRVRLATGSTGKLYAQILHGAPFDVLLAADALRPQLLEREGHAVAGTRRTYALGRLVLWSPDADRIGADGAATLRAGAFRRIAMAQPDLAPYGAAARETLAALGLFDALRGRIVTGENVGQAHAMVATGNAELGLVAWSSVAEAPGSRWLVPSGLYTPIRQQAVLLQRGRENEAARAFLAYLHGPEARARIEAAGYEVE